MNVRATVVVPTYDHGPTLLRSIPTALEQTVEDVEVFVVGDGVPDVTREIMAEFIDRDERVRFFDNAKGPGNGEIHRRAALEQAAGRIVCYLSDDDLWLPEHLEVMEAMLEKADFAHTHPIRVEPEGTLARWSGDLAAPWWREQILAGANFIPLDCAGHTMDLYRRLPHGWRTKPEGVPSDLYMWQQILEQPGCRPVSGTRPTVIHLPSSQRQGWTQDQRLAELDTWAERIRGPGFREELYLTLLDQSARGAAGLEATVREQLGHIEKQRDDTQELHRHIHGLGRWTTDLLHQIEDGRRDRENEAGALRDRLAEVTSELEGTRQELSSVRATRAWRLRDSLLRAPVLGAVLRWAGSARSRREVR